MPNYSKFIGNNEPSLRNQIIMEAVYEKKETPEYACKELYQTKPLSIAKLNHAPLPYMDFVKTYYKSDLMRSKPQSRASSVKPELVPHVVHTKFQSRPIGRYQDRSETSMKLDESQSNFPLVIGGLKCKGFDKKDYQRPNQSRESNLYSPLKKKSLTNNFNTPQSMKNYEPIQSATYSFSPSN